MHPQPGPYARLAERVPVEVLVRIARNAPAAMGHLGIEFDEDSAMVTPAHPDEYLDAVVRSVRRWGVVRPVVVATHSHSATASGPLPQIIDGRHRLAAALLLGLDSIPVVARGRGTRRPSADPVLREWLDAHR